jgi:glucose/mannose-6-phosphate isomerase
MNSNYFEKNILNFNRQLTLKALNFRHLEVLKNRPKPDAVIVCGMGGSGTIADLLQNLASYANIKIPIISWKDYGLPKIFHKNPLYLFISFSGNTQETISGFRRVSQLKAAVSGGGKLTELAEKSKTPLAAFDQNDLVPRQANGLMLYGALGIIKSLLTETEIPDCSKKIRTEKWRKIGEGFAKEIIGTVPLIYTSRANKHLGYFWKIHFNETAKIHAFNNVLPEMNHNEIAGFELKPKNWTVILIKDPADDVRHQKRFQVTEKVLKQIGIPVINHELKESGAFEKTFNSMALAEWTSYYLAKLNNVDPQKTKIIEEIKKLL